MTPANIHYLITLGFILLLILGLLSIVATIAITAHRYESINTPQVNEDTVLPNILKDWASNGSKESPYL